MTDRAHEPVPPPRAFPAPGRRARAGRHLLLGVALGVVMPALAAAQGAAPGAATHVVENVTVIPMDEERSLPEHTVVVRDGRIVALGPASSVEVPADAIRIDGRGRFLAPGLADMHARLPAEDDPLRVVVLDEALTLYLANGVTTLRVMEGAPYQLELRDQIARGAVLGPKLMVASPLLGATSTPDAAAARTQARAHRAAGYQLLSVGPDLSPGAWEGMVATARELDLPFAGRVPAAVRVERALEDGIATIDVLDRYLEATRRAGTAPDAPLLERLRATDDQKLGALARATAEAGVYVVPAQFATQQQLGWNQALGGWVSADSARTMPDLQYVPQTLREGWAASARDLWSAAGLGAETAQAYADWRRELVAALRAAGVDILAGTMATGFFSVPGFSLHRELPLLADAGLSPYEVLSAATRNAARYAEEALGEEADFGTVAVGKRADLLLLDENPLASVATLRNPAGVMVGGRWLARETLDERLARIATRHKDYDTD